MKKVMIMVALALAWVSAANAEDVFQMTRVGEKMVCEKPQHPFGNIEAARADKLVRKMHPHFKPYNGESWVRDEDDGGAYTRAYGRAGTKRTEYSTITITARSNGVIERVYDWSGEIMEDIGCWTAPVKVGKAKVKNPSISQALKKAMASAESGLAIKLPNYKPVPGAQWKRIERGWYEKVYRDPSGKVIGLVVVKEKGSPFIRMGATYVPLYPSD